MDPWIHESMDPWIHSSMKPLIHGSMHPWIHGSMAPWIHACMDQWLHWSGRLLILEGAVKNRRVGSPVWPKPRQYLCSLYPKRTQNIWHAMLSLAILRDTAHQVTAQIRRAPSLSLGSSSRAKLGQTGSRYIGTLLSFPLLCRYLIALPANRNALLRWRLFLLIPQAPRL